MTKPITSVICYATDEARVPSIKKLSCIYLFSKNYGEDTHMRSKFFDTHNSSPRSDPVSYLYEKYHDDNSSAAER